MIKVVKYGLSLLLLIIIGISDADGQNYEQDMMQIRSGYNKKFHSFRMKFVFYPYDSLATATDSMKGYCKMEGTSYYYKISDGVSEYEYLKNEKYYMVVDHPNKMVAINSSSKARPELWSLYKVDSMINTKAIKVSYKNIGKNEGEYLLTYAQKTVWNRLKVTFNKSNYTLTSIFMYSDQRGVMFKQKYSKPKVGIFYSDYSESLPSNSVFSEEKYFHAQGDRLELVDTYKGYKLLNYLKKN